MGRESTMCSEWHAPREHRSSALALYIETAIELLGPAAHVGESQSTLFVFARSESSPVVGDLQQALVTGHAESDAGLGGPSMATNVGHRFSEGGQEMLGDRIRDGRVHWSAERGVHLEASDDGEFAQERDDLGSDARFTVGQGQLIDGGAKLANRVVDGRWSIRSRADRPPRRPRPRGAGACGRR